MLSNELALQAIKQQECPDATAPFYNPALVMARAVDHYIWDIEGRKYVDLCAGFGSVSLGHAPSVMRELFAEFQNSEAPGFPLIQGMGDVYPTQAKLDLIKVLQGCLPTYLQNFAFALTGAQAVEIAIKTAIYEKAEPHILSFAGGYHGVDLGLLPLSGQAFFREPFAGWFRDGQRPYPLGHQALLNQDLQEIEAEFFKKYPLAAVIVEPIQGRAGIRPAQLSWLKGLSSLCKRYGTLFILDEVFTGFGRSGLITHAGLVDCDLVCFGKAMAGGMPVSLCAGRAEVFARWSESKGEARHTGTYFGHPLSLMAAARTIEIIKTQDLPGRAQRLGKKALAYLSEQTAAASIVKEVRGQGLMLVIEFFQPGIGVDLMHRLRAHGLLALVSGSNGECLSFTPSLLIPDDEFLGALATVCEQIFLLEKRDH